jgi:hypothetical protein
MDVRSSVLVAAEMLVSGAFNGKLEDLHEEVHFLCNALESNGARCTANVAAMSVRRACKVQRLLMAFSSNGRKWFRDLVWV